MTKSDLLNQPHYAVIETSTVWIPGDERSRTNPGHGYPEHHEETISYQAFAELDELQSFVERQTTSKLSRMRIIHVTPMTVTTTVNVVPIDQTRSR